ncbi:MAG TPA: 5-(carboxyamino)imidazole ribonucleotide synthase [Marinagarivorans sp.]
MRIAVLGVGQLARMMALDGIAMGVEFCFLKSPGEDSRCVDHLGDVVVAEPNVSAQDLFEQLGSPDVMTTEKEGVDVVFYEQFAKHCAVYPPSKAVWISQNRLREKTFLNEQGVPTAQFEPANSLAEIAPAAAKLGYPVIVKTQENGYDGKGQWWLDSPEDIAAMKGAANSGPWLLEKVVPFECEVSVVAARSPKGQVEVYPAAQNVHRNGILLTSVAPVDVLSDAQLKQVNGHITRLLNQLDYVGVLSMECFVTAEGIVANELAPRVHNSGHWTQNAVQAGQFEQHVRAVLDFPLASTALKGAAGMLNLLGVAATPELALQPNHHWHWYGKEIRAGRKVGHINITADDLITLKTALAKLEREIYS